MSLLVLTSAVVSVELFDVDACVSSATAPSGAGAEVVAEGWVGDLVVRYEVFGS